jgi:hypothetical protein
MHALRSWLRKHTARRRCVAGLDVSADGVQLVILAGDSQSADTVCCAEVLPMPSGGVVNGVVQAPQALARWLKQYVQANDYAVERWFIGLADDQVRYHLVNLSAALSPDDVAFQLQQETRQVFAEHARTFALDYEVDLDPDVIAPASLRYLVGACPQACADSWLEVAHAGGLSLAALEPRRDALARVSQAHFTGSMPAASLALALQCDAAFGLALAGWGRVSYNFLPHRPLWFNALRRAWWVGMAVCAMGGAMLAAGFALVMTASADAKQHRLQQGQPAAQALAQAREDHQRAQTAQKLQAQRDQWVRNRQAAQAQSLAWSEALTQASQGIWVSHIQQHGEHWLLEGEALSSQHAQRLLGHLKALDIWAKPPELPQLQLGTSAVAGDAMTSGSSVWIFRIEAELKAGS